MPFELLLGPQTQQIQNKIHVTAIQIRIERAKTKHKNKYKCQMSIYIQCSSNFLNFSSIVALTGRPPLILKEQPSHVKENKTHIVKKIPHEPKSKYILSGRETLI